MLRVQLATAGNGVHVVAVRPVSMVGSMRHGPCGQDLAPAAAAPRQLVAAQAHAWDRHERASSQQTESHPGSPSVARRHAKKYAAYGHMPGASFLKLLQVLRTGSQSEDAGHASDSDVSGRGGEKGGSKRGGSEGSMCAVQ